MIRGAFAGGSGRLLAGLAGGAVAVLAGATAGAAPPGDAYTPVVARVLSSGTPPFPGTDGRIHLVYELELLNTRPVPATVAGVRLVDAAAPARVLAGFDGESLLARLWSPSFGPAGSPELPPDEVRIVLVDVAFDAPRLSSQVLHRLEVEGASSPAATGPSPLEVLAAPLDLVGWTVPTLGPPLRGGGWVAANGCCEPLGVHRSSGQPVNGQLHYAQRFAIDWMRLDGEGRFVAGDPADLQSYTSYGAEVIAVADGVVVSTLDTLPDQPPGELPDPASITLETVDGNHVVLDLGEGFYAFYAHLLPGSLAVRPGDRVTRGQLLGRLGNSGNTSAPHLHFHLMDGPSVLGSSGLPYVLDAFSLAGQVPVDRFAAAPTIEGIWADGLLPSPEPRTAQFPLDLNVVDFPE